MEIHSKKTIWERWEAVVKEYMVKGVYAQMEIVRATVERLSRDLAGGPKHIYKHKIQQESAPSRGS